MSLLGTVAGRTQTIVGDTVNVAARLERQAPAGGVAISAETARRLDGARTEPLGRRPLKGRAEPLEAHLLLGLVESPHRSRPSARG